jgi:hypothetical protein
MTERPDAWSRRALGQWAARRARELRELYERDVDGECAAEGAKVLTLFGLASNETDLRRAA